MTAKLVLMLNNEVLSEHSLEADEATIGRRFANDIHIDNLGVSGSHAKITVFGSDAFIEDLNSTNGTFVNGEKVYKQLLSDKDIITVGKYQLQYFAATTAPEEDFEKTVILHPSAVSIEATGSAAKAEVETPASSAVKTETSDTAKLVVASGPSKGKSMSLAKTVTRLGKPGQQSSAIAKRPNGYYFVNLAGDSLAAPILNGKPLTVGATQLNHGDLINIGNIELTFSLH